MGVGQLRWQCYRPTNKTHNPALTVWLMNHLYGLNFPFLTIFTVKIYNFLDGCPICNDKMAYLWFLNYLYFWISQFWDRWTIWIVEIIIFLIVWLKVLILQDMIQHISFVIPAKCSIDGT